MLKQPQLSVVLANKTIQHKKELKRRVVPFKAVTVLRTDISLRLSDDLCAFGTVSQKSLGVRAAVAVGSDATERYQQGHCVRHPGPAASMPTM